MPRVWTRSKHATRVFRAANAGLPAHRLGGHEPCRLPGQPDPTKTNWLGEEAHPSPARGMGWGSWWRGAAAARQLTGIEAAAAGAAGRPGRRGCGTQCPKH